MSDDKITQENLVSKLKTHFVNINQIPPHFFTLETINEIIECKEVPYFNLLKVVEKYSAFITYELWLTLINREGAFLEYVPKEFQTLELYNMAVKKHGMHAYKHVPDDVKTVEQTLIALESMYFETVMSLGAINYIPQRLLNVSEVENEVVNVAICFYGRDKTVLHLYIKSFSIQNQSKLVSHVAAYCPRVNSEICEYEDWLRYSWSVKEPHLHRVPSEYQTEELMLYCLKRKPSNVQYVKEGDLSFEFLHKAVEANHGVYLYLNDKHKTYELTLAFLKDLEKNIDGYGGDILRDALAKIPEEYIRDEVGLLCQKLQSESED